MSAPPAVTATRYVTPLREGGSLPGLMEADDLGMYVVKFTGAGQGPNVLVAEIVCAELARGLGLPVPRWAPVVVPAELAPAEPDAEVQRLLRESAGLNLGIDFLPGATDVGPAPSVDPGLAGRILWFDALVDNRDRSWRNPNMLMWHRQVHLIDHGAALAFQHAWPSDRGEQVERFATKPYDISEHVLLRTAPDVTAADEAAGRLDWPRLVAAALRVVPDEWLDPRIGSPEDGRDAYAEFLLARLDRRREWVPRLVEDSDPVAVAGRPRDVRRVRRPAWLTGPTPPDSGGAVG